MKSIFLVLFFVVSNVFAQQCEIIVPAPPGGALDIYARGMQKIDSSIRLEYKPGAYSSVAVKYMNDHPRYGLIAPPNMHSTQFTGDHNTDLLYMILGADVIALTSKNISTTQLKTDKLTIGIPLVGNPHHVVALELQKHNPNITIVPFGSDLKALPALINKDVDLYITAPANANKWVNEFDVRKLFEVPFNKHTTVNGVSLTNVGWSGIFVSKKATVEQRANIVECTQRVINNPQWVVEMRNVGVIGLNLDGKEKDKFLNYYQDIMKKYGL